MSAPEIAEGPKRFGVQERPESHRRRSKVSAPGRTTRPALFDDAKAMKIATFNLNGVNGRLPVLLRRLQETSPDASCRLPGGDTSFQRFLRIGVCFFLRRERRF
jgi:hypothetical protein